MRDINNDIICIFRKMTITLRYQLILFWLLSVIILNVQAFGKPAVIINGLNHPWSMVFLDDNRLLITERNGDLLLFDGNKKITLDLPITNVYAQGQGGLLDLALAPDYAKSGWIYLSYSQENDNFQATTALARLQLKNQKISKWQLLYTAKPYIRSSHHFGGRLAFDKAGQIYLTVGDRGQRHLAQNPNNDIGTILRLNADGTIPADNLFNNAVYSYGHRNPQGLIYTNNQLIAHEHGPRGGDELNRIQKGGNYGWPVISYGKEYLSNKSVGIGTHKQGMVQPLHYWVPSIAPSGLAVLTKNDTTQFFVGSLKFKELVQLTLKNQQILDEKRLFSKQFGRIRDVKVRLNYLYFLLDSNHGQLIKIALDEG